MTEDQIRKEYQDSGQLQDHFGSFDSYMTYIGESQDWVQSAEWMMANPEYEKGEREWLYNNREDVMYRPGERDELQNKIQTDISLARQNAYALWLNEGAELMDKWGLNRTIYNDDGDKFKWTGSGYQKTYKVDDHAGVGDYIKTAIVTGAALAATPALASALGGIGGAALPAGLAGPSAPLIGGKLATGLAAGATSAATQGLLTGSIDPKSVLASAVVGGINPGGKLAEKFGQATGTGVNIVPDNVVGGFLQGAGNSVVSQGIAEGDVDLKSALIAGGLGAGTKAITDLFDDTSQHSIESKMRQISAERSAQGLPSLPADELYDAAVGALSLGNTSGSGMGPPEYGGPNSMVGRSDLGGLIGKDGLLSFIPTLPTTGLNRFLGGGQWAIGEYFVGPDGKRYTDTEMWEMGVDPVAAYNGQVDGWEHFKDPITPIDTDTNGFLDALANENFENTYGINPAEYMAGNGSARDLVRLITYGPLDETYNFSVNPRGTTEILGLLTGIDQYSTGSNNISANLDSGEGRSITDAINISDMQAVADAGADAIASGSTAIINAGNDQALAVDALSTLPGSDITVTDAITQGIIDGVVVANSDDSSNSNASSNTADLNAGETAVSKDETLAGADPNAGETTVSTDKTLDGTETNVNENAVITDKTLAGSEEAVDPTDVLTSGDGGGGGGLGIPTGGRGGALTDWTDLYGYTKISPYKKARLKVLAGMLSGIPGVSMGSLALNFGSEKDPYQKIGRAVWDFGQERNA
jgi:hypothetical protein